MTEDQIPHELTKRDGLFAMLYASPIMLLFAYMGDWKRCFGAWISIGIVVLVVRMRWDLRDRGWFWVVVAIMGIIQAPFIYYIPWSNTDLSYASLLPVGFLDFAVVYGCIRLVERAMKRRITK